MPMLTMRLEEDDQRRLAQLAEKRKLPVSTLARSLLVQMMDREEDPALRAREILDAIEGDTKLQFHLRRLALFMDGDGPTG